MQDIAHDWGSDLTIGPTGDLALAAANLQGRQRLLRRLLTNSGDYIWHLTYGAGLAGCVGQPVDALQVQALIRSQVSAEACVAARPAPSIAVSADQGGAVYVQLAYTDAASGQPQSLNFSVDA